MVPFPDHTTTRGARQDTHHLAGSDVHSRWRVGTIYMESDDGSGAVATRNYAVLRPEQETRTYKSNELPPIQVHKFGDPYGSTYRALNETPAT
jgi:hypothetical protein